MRFLFKCAFSCSVGVVLLAALLALFLSSGSPPPPLPYRAPSDIAVSAVLTPELPPNFGRGTKPLAVVTGANTGVGFEAARALIARGYEVVVASRSIARGEAAVDTLGKNAAFVQLDLANFSSVVTFALALRRADVRLDALVLNAGMNVRAGEPLEARRTIDGFEICFQSNYLGHALLAELLLPRLLHGAAVRSDEYASFPAAIITLGSVASWQVSSSNCCNADRWAAAFVAHGAYNYPLSKLACTAQAMWLARQLAALHSRVRAVAINPGAVLSDIWRHWPDAARVATAPLMALAFLTPAQAAVSVVSAAADAEGVASGSYLVPYAPWGSQWPLAPLGEIMGPFAGPTTASPPPLAADAALADALQEATIAAIAPALQAYAQALPADAAGAAASNSDGWAIDVPFSAQLHARLAEVGAT